VIHGANVFLDRPAIAEVIEVCLNTCGTWYLITLI